MFAVPAAVSATARTPQTVTLPDGSRAYMLEDPSGTQTVVVKRYRKFEVDVDPAPYTAPFAFYVPHTARHPETAASAPSNATWVDVSQSNIAYYAAMLGWWAKAETFMILEHDVAITADVIEEIDACPEPWCVFPYDNFCHRECREAWRFMLGCTRFRAELVQAVPDAISSIPPDNWDWHNMCDGVGNNLRAAGFVHHWHESPVRHHCRTANEA